MGATTLFFGGRVTGIPGSYSVVDASGLEVVGLGASGIIAVLGTAEGGRPISAVTRAADLQRATKPERVRQYFRSGDLRDVGDVLFAPARDEDVPGGAQEVVFAKVNPATQGTLTLTNAAGDAIDLTSEDWGAFVDQISVLLGAATSPLTGYALQIQLEDTVESVDGLGGDAVASLEYTATYSDPAHTGGWEFLSGASSPSAGLVLVGSLAELGLDSAITVPTITTDVTIESSAADTGIIRLFGVDGSSNPITADVALNNTSPVTVPGFTAGFVYGAYKVGGAGDVTGTVTVKTNGGVTTMFTILPADAGTGVRRVDAGFVAGDVISVTGTASDEVLVYGTKTDGSVGLERLVMTGSPVDTTASFRQLLCVVLGAVPIANSVTIAADALVLDWTTYPTLRAVKEYVDSLAETPPGGTSAVGWEWTNEIADLDFDPAELDAVASLSVTPGGSAVGLLADLWYIIEWINANSQLVTAEKATGAVNAPDTFASPQFLSGGSEGVPTQSDWQDALDILKQARINSVVALTGDSAVHAALEAHCAYMTVVGRSERDGFIGLATGSTASFTLKTKTEIKAEILALNSRHVRVAAQSIERYSPEGVLTEYPPWYFAALLAGAQSGSAVGTSLTHKYINVLGLKQHSTWNPVDDAEEMIQAGLVFAEEIEGQGRRVVRNITTHLSTSNIAFTEASVNEAANYAVYQLRTALERAVGKKGFAGTVQATRAVAVNILGLLVDETILTAWRSLDVELVVDVLEVSVEIAPVVPINFVATTVHLVTLPIAA